MFGPTEDCGFAFLSFMKAFFEAAKRLTGKDYLQMARDRSMTVSMEEPVAERLPDPKPNKLAPLCSVISERTEEDSLSHLQGNISPLRLSRPDMHPPGQQGMSLDFKRSFKEDLKREYEAALGGKKKGQEDKTLEQPESGGEGESDMSNSQRRGSTSYTSQRQQYKMQKLNEKKEVNAVPVPVPPYSVDTQVAYAPNPSITPKLVHSELVEDGVIPLDTQFISELRKLNYYYPDPEQDYSKELDKSRNMIGSLAAANFLRDEEHRHKKNQSTEPEMIGIMEEIEAAEESGVKDHRESTDNLRSKKSVEEPIVEAKPTKPVAVDHKIESIPKSSTPTVPVTPIKEPVEPPKSSTTKPKIPPVAIPAPKARAESIEKAKPLSARKAPAKPVETPREQSNSKKPISTKDKEKEKDKDIKHTTPVASSKQPAPASEPTPSHPSKPTATSAAHTRPGAAVTPSQPTVSPRPVQTVAARPTPGLSGRRQSSQSPAPTPLPSQDGHRGRAQDSPGRADPHPPEMPRLALDALPARRVDKDRPPRTLPSTAQEEDNEGKPPRRSYREEGELLSPHQRLPSQSSNKPLLTLTRQRYDEFMLRLNTQLLADLQLQFPQ